MYRFQGILRDAAGLPGRIMGMIAELISLDLSVTR